MKRINNLISALAIIPTLVFAIIISIFPRSVEAMPQPNILFQALPGIPYNPFPLSFYAVYHPVLSSPHSLSLKLTLQLSSFSPLATKTYQKKLNCLFTKDMNILHITTVRLKYFSNYKPSEIKRFNDITPPTGLKLSP